MKYTRNSFDDPYLDQKTGVLKNLLNIKNQTELDIAESGFSFLRTNELQDYLIKGSFDLIHLQEIHKRLFCDIYEWAGKIRQVEVQKGKTLFARYMMIESAANQLFKKLAIENYLCDLDKNEFCLRSGYYLGEINVLHPFREGNGRTQREFINQLANNAKYMIDWSEINKEEMIIASIAAYNGNPKYLAEIIKKSLK